MFNIYRVVSGYAYHTPQVINKNLFINIYNRAIVSTIQYTNLYYQHILQ